MSPQAMAARLLPLAALLLGLSQAGLTGLHQGGEAPAICLLSPAASREQDGVVRAISPLPDPTIFARGGFAEIRLEQNGRLLWRRRAGSELPLQGPLAWPLPPLRPGERLLLRLRPIEVGNGDFASVELLGAKAATMARSVRLRRSLGRQPQAWLRTVLHELEQGSRDLALALLYDFHGPASPELNALRREIHDRACDSLLFPPSPFPP
jgi:hypothetical protein